MKYDRNRKFILYGPDHSYRFHPSILGANQQIRGEAMDLFLRENTFVSLRHNMDYDWGGDPKLRKCGVAILARGNRARAFPAIGMAIELDVDRRWYYAETGRRRPRTRVEVFTVDDLPAACVCLQRLISGPDNILPPVISFPDHRISKAVNIRVTVSSGINRADCAWYDRRPVAGSKLFRCLEPLRRVRHASRVEIYSPGCVSYIDDLEAMMCGWPLSVKETMDLVVAHFDRGDQHYLSGALKPAIAEYKAALRTLPKGTFDEKEEDEAFEDMVGGRFDGLSSNR